MVKKIISLHFVMFFVASFFVTPVVAVNVDHTQQFEEAREYLLAYAKSDREKSFIKNLNRDFLHEDIAIGWYHVMRDAKSENAKESAFQSLLQNELPFKDPWFSQGRSGRQQHLHFEVKGYENKTIDPIRWVVEGN